MADYPNLILTGKAIKNTYLTLVQRTGSQVVGADGNVFQIGHVDSSSVAGFASSAGSANFSSQSNTATTANIADLADHAASATTSETASLANTASWALNLVANSDLVAPVIQVVLTFDAVQSTPQVYVDEGAVKELRFAGGDYDFSFDHPVSASNFYGTASRANVANVAISSVTSSVTDNVRVSGVTGDFEFSPVFTDGTNSGPYRQLDFPFFQNVTINPTRGSITAVSFTGSLKELIIPSSSVAQPGSPTVTGLYLPVSFNGAQYWIQLYDDEPGV